MQPSPATNDHSKFRCEQPRPGRCIARCQKTTVFAVTFALSSALIPANPLVFQVSPLLPEASQSSGLFK